MPTNTDAALQLHHRALEAAAAAFEADAKSLRATAIDHPFLGRLPLLDLVRLLEIHTRHHQAQLEPTGA